MLRGCTVFRQMEEERLEQLRNLGERYNMAMGEHRPKLVASSQRLEEPIANCNVRQDMEDVSKKGSQRASPDVRCSDRFRRIHSYYYISSFLTLTLNSHPVT